MKRQSRKFVKIFGALIILMIMNVCYAAASEDPDACWSNCSNIEVTSRSGCEEQRVFQYCPFYVNFWNPNGNLQMRSATATFIKNGQVVATDTVSSSDSNHCFYYASIPFYLEEAGDYLLEREITLLDGSTYSLNMADVSVGDVSECGASLSVSPQSVTISMTGTKEAVITSKVSGIMPRELVISYEILNSSDVSCSWGEWYDSDEDGETDTVELTVTGIAGGSAEIIITLQEETSEKIIAFRYVTVEIGPNYTVSYDANGGNDAPSEQTKYYGKALTLSDIEPTRTGYDFLGWSTSRTAQTALYHAGDLYETDSKATLYAVWKLKEYWIKYDANGGSGAPAAQKKYYGMQLTLSTTEPTRTGYKFIGWSTDSAGKTVIYRPGDTYKREENVTLYAVWEIIDPLPQEESYTVSYDANGGSGEPPAQTKYYGKALTLSDTKPTRTGYDFLGWSTSRTAQTALYQAGDLYETDSDVTLYAVWKLKEYWIKYDANGGSGEPPAQTKYYGISLRLSTVEPTRTGCMFMGWSTDSAGETVMYQPGEEYVTDGDVVLYAVWKNIETLPPEESETNGPIAPGGNETNGMTEPSGNETNGMTEPGGNETNGMTEPSGSGTSETTKPGGSETSETTKPEGNGNTETKQTEKGKKKKTQKIKVKSEIIKEYAKNKKFNLGAKAKGKLSYQSKNKKVATISKTGKVTIKGYGKATIIVTAAATKSYKKTSTKVTLKICPSKITLQTISRQGNNSIKIVWKKSKEVDEYEIQCSANKKFPIDKTFSAKIKKVTSAVLPNLTKGKTYYVRMRGIKYVNGVPILSEYSKIKSIKI